MLQTPNSEKLCILPALLVGSGLKQAYRGFLGRNDAFSRLYWLGVD